jgi:hypothetical protein
MDGSGRLQAPVALFLAPSGQKVGEPQSRSGHDDKENNSAAAENRMLVVQAVTNLNIHSAIRGSG